MSSNVSAADGIGVVVVSHQSASSIDDCLHALRLAAGVAAIRVVDNASHDDTLPRLRAHALADARVRFIANDDNPGFAAACNQGAAVLDTAWLALVNPDCIVAADSLARLRAHAESIAAPCLLGADLVDADGVADSAARRRDPDFLALLRDPRWLAALPRDPARALQSVPVVSGALMLLPMVLYRQLGGMDAGYRLHAEDLDLCRRARAFGAAVAVANDVSVLHLRGVSSRRKPWFVEWHKHRGLWRYHRRFDATRHPAPLNALVWLGIWAHFPLAIARGLWRKWRADRA